MNEHTAPDILKPLCLDINSLKAELSRALIKGLNRLKRHVLQVREV